MEFELRALFEDRADAGHRLGVRLLSDYRDEPAIVLGLARGGVLVAAEIAKLMRAPLDLLVVRKVGSPYSPELAIGAVTANGGLYLNEEIIRSQEVSQAYLEEEVGGQRELATQREELYRRGRLLPDLDGKTAILVDDGMATGSSMTAAVRSVRDAGAASVHVAVPVGAPESCDEMREEADEVVCLYMPEPFWAVGLYYNNFAEVSDDEVIESLGQTVIR